MASLDLLPFLRDLLNRLLANQESREIIHSSIAKHGIDFPELLNQDRLYADGYRITGYLGYRPVELGNLGHMPILGEPERTVANRVPHNELQRVIALYFANPVIVFRGKAFGHRGANQPLLDGAVSFSRRPKGGIVGHREFERSPIVIVPAVPIEPADTRSPVQNVGTSDVGSGEFL